MTTWITICDTCKRDGWAESGATETDGTRFAGLVESLPLPDGVRVRRHGCLMGCGKGCNVAVQAEDKLCYTLGGFAPEEEAAQALLDWAALHAESDSGQVPYRQWPQGVKGHFVTRHPPLPKP